MGNGFTLCEARGTLIDHTRARHHMGDIPVVGCS